MIETIKTYRTSDGTIFDNIDDARVHERNTNLVTEYNNDPLPGITPAQMGGWLRRNKHIVKLFFGFN